MESKIADFNGKKVEIKSLKMKSANILFPLVISGMAQLAIGNFDFFSKLKPSDIELFQEKLCENTIIYDESEDSTTGSKIVTKRQLSLADISENLSGFLPLLFVFLEFNFGFFSKARKILDPILTEISESVEK